MKSLIELDNSKRAKLLASLFPEEIPNILESIKNQQKILVDNEAEVRETWQNGLFTFNSWFSLAKECVTAIDRYAKKNTMSIHVFSEQLFYGYLSLYTIHCIIQYADKYSDNQKFKLMVDLIFKP